MKIDFITVHRTKNYGSALLCYASQRLFERHGFDVEFIDFARMQANEVDTWKDFYRAKIIDSEGCWVKGFAHFLLEIPYGIRVIKAFVSFRKKYLHLSEESYGNNEQLLNAKPPLADIYCTGGDQMWNEQYNFHRVYKPFFLSFVPKGKPKISFSTSIGKEKFDDWELTAVVPLLKDYNMISVREKSAMNNLQKLGITNVTHIQDPTFLLEAKEWEDMSAQRIFEKPYILVYRFVPNDELDREIEEISKKTGKTICYIKNKSMRIIPENKNIFVLLEPQEFISAIKYADYIITDSFHGTVFSIKLKKKFVSVFSKHSTRIESILNICGLSDRKYEKQISLLEQLERPINYSKIDDVWRREREKADKWIEQTKELVNK